MRLPVMLGIAVVLTACSGGGSSGPPAVPVLPWASFRHDNGNSGIGNPINNNKGTVTLLAPLPGTATTSTPAIDRNGNIFLGTANGVVSYANDGTLRWTFTTCVLNPPPGSQTPRACPSLGCTVPVGPVSASPTVTAGAALVFGSDGSNGTPAAVFAVQESNGKPTCLWYFRPDDAGPDFSVTSSAAVQVNAFDRTITTVVIGTGNGSLYTLNADGTPRWSFSTGTDEPITSTPALDTSSNAYITTPDGFLAGIDPTGKPLPGGVVSIGAPPAATYQPSPGVSASLYAIGEDSTLFAFLSGGINTWSFTPPAPFSGSPAYLPQSFGFEARTVSDTIVYAVDDQGTVFPIRSSNGTIQQIQRCSGATTVTEMMRDCRMDSCLPSQGTCNASNNRCSISGTVMCTRDTCSVNTPDLGTCTARSGILSVPPTPTAPTPGPDVVLATSPVISSDRFVVIGTTDGRVCARSPEGLTPGADQTPPPVAWSTGCVALGDGLPTLSSPVIGLNSNIFVTTASGLYVIR
jgi:hypothetical protein